MHMIAASLWLAVAGGPSVEAPQRTCEQSHKSEGRLSITCSGASVAELVDVINEHGTWKIALENPQDCARSLFMVWSVDSGAESILEGLESLGALTVIVRNRVTHNMKLRCRVRNRTKRSP